MTIEVWFNPRCSKCRQVRDRLDEAGLAYELYEYLDAAPQRADLDRVLALLGTDDPLVITRRKEALFAELGLAGAGREALLAALVANPRLIERPIVIRGDRAVVARPPERVAEVLD